MPLRTAQRWLTSYRVEGAAALVRSGRTDRGGWRIAAELVELIEGLALRRPPPQIAQLHRKVAGGRPPSKVCRRGRINRCGGSSNAWTVGWWRWAHYDPDVYRDQFELVLRREAVHANDVWQADHTELDVQVLDDQGRAVRPLASQLRRSGVATTAGPRLAIHTLR